MYHYYVNPNNVIKRPLHWDPEENIDRPTNWADLKNRGRERLNQIVENNLMPPYGLGSVKSLEDYANFTGLDIKNRSVIKPDNVFKFTDLNELKWTKNAEKFKFLI